MVIKVKGKDIFNIFNDFVSNGKLMFNFLSNGKKLEIQLIEEYIMFSSIPCESIDKDFNEVEMSCYISGDINIIEKEEDVTITFLDSMITFEQISFKYSSIKEYEARQQEIDLSGLGFKTVPIQNINSLVRYSRALSKVTKEIKSVSAEPCFVNNKLYISTINIAIITDFKFDDCGLSNNTIKSISSKLNNKSTYCQIPDKSLIVFKSDIYTFYVHTMNYNIKMNVINSLESAIKSLKYLTTININKFYDKLRKISSTSTNQMLSFSIGENSFRVIMSNNSKMISIGNSDITLTTISMSSGRLSALLDVLNIKEDIEVLIGGNSICFKTGETHILIAGLLY